MPIRLLLSFISDWLFDGWRSAGNPVIIVGAENFGFSEINKFSPYLAFIDTDE
jgi:hypothetical protein